MFKFISIVFIAVAVIINEGDKALVDAEVFQGGSGFSNIPNEEANPWRRFWGGQCVSDASCTYIVSYCHYKKTGKYLTC